MLLKVDKRRSHINVSHRAQVAMAELGIGKSIMGRRRDVIHAIDRFEPIAGTAQVR